MATAPDPELLLVLLKKKRAGTLHGDERSAYRATADAFLDLVLANQNAGSRTAHQPRRSVRVARSIEVDLTERRVPGRSLSLDIGLGGFSALLARPLDLDTTFMVRLRLRGEEWISPRVQVASVQARRGVYRVSFAFVALSEDNRDLLEMAIVSDLLAKLGPAAPSPPRSTDIVGVSGRARRRSE